MSEQVRDGLVRVFDGDKTTWVLTLSRFDVMGMDREQLDMIEDAIWLIQQSLIGRVEGPLTLPITRLPIRGTDWE